jgi:hypothetical protein
MQSVKARLGHKQKKRFSTVHRLNKNERFLLVKNFFSMPFAPIS